ncbi:P-loop ATPase, Sll1717 family [Streptomyces sp. NPDC002765]
MPRVADFRRCDFGYADSGAEFRHAPRLLRHGYYDLGHAEEQIVSSPKFLILGYKGSGKSAIGARLRIRATDSPALYSAPAPIFIDKLPLGEFRGIVPDTFGAPVRHRHVWTLHLLVHIAATLSGDGQAEWNSKAVMSEVSAQLQQAGITSRHPSTMRKFRTTKVTATAGVPNIASLTAEVQRATDASTLVDWISYLEATTSSFKSSRRHYLFVDGLDDSSLVRGGREGLLGGLIEAAADLNSLYFDSESPIKVIVCCRTDLYSKLNLARSGKIREDYGLELNWYQNPGDYRRTHLIKLANQRAQLADPATSDIFSEFFPKKIARRNSVEFLMLQTRHTPRDLLQLLKTIQRHVEDPDSIPEEIVKAGSREYSEKYFAHEMRDALSTYFNEDQLSRITQLLGTLRQRRFSYEELRDLTDTDARFRGRIDLHDALIALFDNGFVGNVSKDPVGGYDEYFRFKFRNPYAALVYDESMQLHPGLWKAFNLA